MPSQDAAFPDPPIGTVAPSPKLAATNAVDGPPADGSAAAAFVQPIDDDPGRLLGLDRKALRALLGKPGFVRRDDPARMWRYRHANCVLDLFLYAKAGAPAPSFRVRHVEARAGDLQATSTRRCLRALLVARTAPSTG